MLIKNDKVYYAHIGDSRIYYFNDSGTSRLTKDHSFVQTLVDGGHITAEEAEMHPRKNEIYKALGIHTTVEPTICDLAIIPADGEYILLCTDGLTGMVGDNIIQKIVQKISNFHK